MALNLLALSLLLLVVNPFEEFVESRTLSSSAHLFTNTLQNLEGAQKGQTVKGLRELKLYLQKFGYLSKDHDLSNDHFDGKLESALKDYQRYFQLDATGRLDPKTIKKMGLSRCGVPDITPHKRSGLVMVSNYTFFPGSPKWDSSKRDLTYKFSSSAEVLSIDDVRQTVANAFRTWQKVTAFTFSEVGTEQQADIVLGFHRGDHGDGYPFDGPGQVLAHAFAPQDGRLHYDADEGWTTTTTTGTPTTDGNDEAASVDGRWRWRRRRRRPVTKTQIDLETVALHELGHILGLGHSENSDSIMYPTYEGVRRDLRQDDINGIQALYN